MHFIILVGLSQTQNKLLSSCLVWYEQQQDFSNLFTHIQHHAEINTAQLCSITEITPKAPFVSVNRSPIVWFLCQHIIQGRIQDFFRRGCTHLLLSFNTNKPHSCFFCGIPVVLENHRSSRGGGWGAQPLHPSPRSAPVIISGIV